MIKLLLTFIFTLPVFSTTMITSPRVDKSKPPGTDKSDQIITNRAFRASTGSLSDWSINSTWNYEAGSIEDPLNVERPNITAAGDVAELQTLNANIGVSYRLTKIDRFTFGIGLNTVAPFHKTYDSENSLNQEEFNENRGKVDLNDPSLAYTRVFRLYEIQTVATLSALQYTTGIYVDRGYDYNLELSINTMYEFTKTGLSAGALIYGSRNYFDSAKTELQPEQVETTIGLLPQLEYVINDTFNLRTIFRPWWYQNRRNQADDEYTMLDFTQSIGLGISITRDFFLYPNIQFVPDNLQSEKTNLGLSAYINLF